MPTTSIQGKVSMHLGKKYSIKHNKRDYDMEKWNKDGHVDEKRSHLNETFFDKDLQEFFEETFSESIAEFNAKNEKKHPDRVIQGAESYYQEQKDKVQECIIQMGDHEEYLKMVEEVGQSRADEIHKEFLRGAYENWLKENPSFKVFHATAHFDEIRDGTPHLHLDFIPVATAEKGLKVRVSMEGALKNSTLKDGGFIREKKQKFAESPYKQWLKEQRSSIEQQASKYIKVQPSEPTTKGHMESYQHKYIVEKEKGIKKLLQAFKKSPTIETAQKIIENSEEINNFLKQEGLKEKEEVTKERMKLKREMEESKDLLERRVPQIKLQLLERNEQLNEREKKQEEEKKKLEEEKKNFYNTVENEVNKRYSETFKAHESELHEMEEITQQLKQELFSEMKKTFASNDFSELERTAQIAKQSFNQIVAEHRQQYNFKNPIPNRKKQTTIERE